MKCGNMAGFGIAFAFSSETGSFSDAFYTAPKESNRPKGKKL